MKQEVVHKGGKNFLRIHGDCEGGTVKVRLRSRSRENLKPKPPWSVPVITLHNIYIVRFHFSIAKCCFTFHS